MSEVRSEGWAEIARQYTDGVPIAVIAKRFDISRARITRRAKKWGWIHGSGNDGHAGSHAPTQDGRPGSSQEKGAASSVSDQRTALIERQRAAWETAYSLRDEAFRILNGEAPEIIKDVEIGSVEQRLSLSETLLALFAKDVSALAAAQEGERRAYWICYKRLQEAGPTDEAEARRRRELMASIFSLASTMRHSSDSPEGSEQASQRFVQPLA